MLAPILISDEEDVLAALRLLFKREGFATVTASTADGTIAALKSNRCALLLMDLNSQQDTTAIAERLALLQQVSEDASPPVQGLAAKTRRESNERSGNMRICDEHLDLADFGLRRTTNCSACGAWEDLTLEDAEKRLLQVALRKHAGNATAAAKALGLSRSAFYRRLEKYGY